VLTSQGIIFTAGAMWYFLQAINIPIHVQEVIRVSHTFISSKTMTWPGVLIISLHRVHPPCLTLSERPHYCVAPRLWTNPVCRTGLRVHGAALLCVLRAGDICIREGVLCRFSVMTVTTATQSLQAADSAANPIVK
jgi:hypothetical protein